MARRLVVSIGGLAQQATLYSVAVDGVVKPIYAASVAHEGFVRQYYPFGEPLDPADPRLQWTTDALTVHQSVIDPADSSASINFSRSLGTYSYKNYPGGDGTAPFLVPPLDGTASDDDLYLIKVDQVSGDALTGTLATWTDLNSAASLEWSLDAAVVGTLNAVATITLAEDNGAGAPVSGSTIAKTVTFISTVQGSATDIAWTTVQRDLVEIKEAVDADCDVEFYPTGSASGLADTSGAFAEAWHIDNPSVVSPGSYSVKATQVSGTAVTGSALGTALSLDTLRTWKLSATTNEDNDAVLDIEVDTIPTSTPVVKRITMNAQRTEIPDPNWDTTAWSCTDSGFNQSLALLAQVKLTFAADGTAKLQMESNVMPITEFETGTWFSGVPADLNDYECRINNLNGGGITSGQTEGTWVRMAEIFTIEFTTLKKTTAYTFDADVRKVGGLTTTKVINVEMIAAAKGAPA